MNFGPPPRCHLPTHAVAYPRALSRSAIVFSVTDSPKFALTPFGPPPLNSWPNRVGYRPVSRPARHGLQYVAATYPLVNRTPFFAMESMFGVGICLLPWNPISP